MRARRPLASTCGSNGCEDGLVARVRHSATARHDRERSGRDVPEIGRTSQHASITGDASFEITEILRDADRVYVRWLLTRPASQSHGAGLREVGSAVYRVECGRLAEYWIQLDRYAAALREQILEERE